MLEFEFCLERLPPFFLIHFIIKSNGRIRGHSVYNFARSSAFFFFLFRLASCIVTNFYIIFLYQFRKLRAQIVDFIFEMDECIVMLRLIVIGGVVRVAFIRLVVRWQYAGPSWVGDMRGHLLSEAELNFWLVRDEVYVWIIVALRKNILRL